MSPKPILYSLEWSPVARAVLLTAKYIGLDLEVKNVNLLELEQLSPEFLKMNPQHTVPTLDDNGIYLWESAAICTYLIAKYGPTQGGSPLYPVDLVQRARIDQRLYFNAGILFPLVRQITIDVFFKRLPQLPAALLADIGKALDHLERFLQADQYLVGSTLTLADVATATTVGNLMQWTPLQTGQHDRIVVWLKRVSAELPGYEEWSGKLVEYGEMFRAGLKRNQGGE